jgi:hypothetical protein
LHLAATALLLAAALALGGLAAAGRVHFGPPAPGGQERQDRPASSAAGGRYEIEKVDDVRELLDNAGRLGFFGQQVLEAWVFRYAGGYLQCQLEGEENGQPVAGAPLPGDWKSLLAQDEGVAQGRAGAFRKQGYIVLTAMPSTVGLDEALAAVHLPLSGLFAGAGHGPLHALPPLHLEVSHRRPYRLFLSAGPPPKTPGAGFNLWAEQLLTVRGPLVPRPLGGEPFHAGGGKDLAPGKDVVLLDRKRGHSRVRLKARFLGDGEVREMAGK